MENVFLYTANNFMPSLGLLFGIELPVTSGGQTFEKYCFKNNG